MGYLHDKAPLPGGTESWTGLQPFCGSAGEPPPPRMSVCARTHPAPLPPPSKVKKKRKKDSLPSVSIYITFGMLCLTVLFTILTRLIYFPTLFLRVRWTMLLLQDFFTSHPPPRLPSPPPSHFPTPLRESFSSYLLNPDHVSKVQRRRRSWTQRTERKGSRKSGKWGCGAERRSTAQEVGPERV